jgi:hypothetical protein
MTTSREEVPFGSSIEAIDLVSFDGSQTINLMAQRVELNIHQSINEPLMKGSLILYDAIGLFVNFPLVGEEYIIVTIKPTQKVIKQKDGSFTFENDDKLIRHAFVIDSIQNITPADDARSVNYIINLISRPAFENVRHNVSHAYHGRTSQIAKSLFEDYLYRPAQLNTGGGSREAFFEDQYTFEDIEESIGDDTRTVVIPNYKPIAALKWLADKAVSSDFERNYYYRFYQTFDGFHFTTIQEIIRDKARAKAEDEKFKFYSDASLIDQDDFYQQFKAITNITINDRFSTLNKIVDGYFENQLFEINMMQNTYRQNNSDLDDYITTVESRQQFIGPINAAVNLNQQLNTDEYSKSVIASDPPIAYTGIDPTSETYNRVYYTFNNYAEGDVDQPILNIQSIWGNKERSQSAFAQIDFSIIIPGNTRIQAGELIYIEFPEMHGFNDINEDPFIDGFFVVTDVRHLYTVGGVHSTHLKINKDSYGTDIDTEPYKYGPKL